MYWVTGLLAQDLYITRIAVSGLRTSCATPAISSPMWRGVLLAPCGAGFLCGQLNRENHQSTYHITMRVMNTTGRTLSSMVRSRPGKLISSATCWCHVPAYPVLDCRTEYGRTTGVRLPYQFMTLIASDDFCCRFMVVTSPWRSMAMTPSAAF